MVGAVLLAAVSPAPGQQSDQLWLRLPRARGPTECGSYIVPFSPQAGPGRWVLSTPHRVKKLERGQGGGKPPRATQA